MKQIFFLFFFVLGFSFSTQAQTTTEHEVIKLEKELRAALVKGDFAFYERHIADDYYETNASAGIRTKDFVAQLKARKFERYDLDDLKARVYSEADIVTGRFHRKESYPRDGKMVESENRGRFTSVWVKRDGRWQRTIFHQSIMPQQAQ